MSIYYIYFVFAHCECTVFALKFANLCTLKYLSFQAIRAGMKKIVEWVFRIFGRSEDELLKRFRKASPLL